MADSFYWNCLSPNGGGEPTGKVLDAINKSFGSFADFKEQFTKSAVTNFGSGWTWLVKDSNGNVVMTGGVVTYNSIILEILQKHVGEKILAPSALPKLYRIKQGKGSHRK